MSIGNPTEWLAGVSKVCRSITEQSVIAARDARELGAPSSIVLSSAQSVLTKLVNELENLLPQDFPPSRLSDLHRHVHYCQQHDCTDIAAFDIPDILEKAENYAVERVPAAPSGDIGSYLHPYYRARLDRELETADPDFHALIMKSCVKLGDVFKAQAKVQDDKDTEIGRALKPDAPRLKVLDDVSTDTGRNFQRGTMLLLQGTRAFYRNTFAHTEIQINSRQAVQALTLISLLTEILETSHFVEPEDSE